MLFRSLGHEAGDRLLAEVARRLRLAVDPELHLVARMGGDEFVIMVPRTTDSSDMTHVAKAALSALEEPIALDGRRLSITASLGLVERPAAGAQPVELLRAADMTMYWAKADGKARWALFDQERNQREVARYALSQALPAALEHGELFLEYQPIVDLSTGATHAMEALVRWNHPTRGLLGPGEFVPLAEETGMIVALGRWVIRRAVQDAAAWPPAPDGRRVAVSVNVAARQVHEPYLIADVTEALGTADLPAELLQLEITETAVMNLGQGGQLALETLRGLASLGVQIAIDDFGTGYLSLKLLRDVQVREIKIDKSIVARLAHDPKDAAIVRATVDLAHALGLKVVAEGVEDEITWQRLAEFGCDVAQGRLVSRELPADEAATWLSQYVLSVPNGQRTGASPSV